MRRFHFTSTGLYSLRCLLIATFIGCATTPMTNRRQLLLIPESEEITMGLSSFAEIVASETDSTNREWIEMVHRVGQRLAAAANRPDYDWEFRLINSPQQNAFCLPGGKVAIYEGILPVCQSEAGLAVVMAHEVAHALARHGGERMSQSYVVDGVGRVLSQLNQSQEVVSNEQLNRAYGVASEYGFVLPYSRKHELEADHMGMLLMAMPDTTHVKLRDSGSDSDKSAMTINRSSSCRRIPMTNDGPPSCSTCCRKRSPPMIELPRNSGWVP